MRRQNDRKVMLSKKPGALNRKRLISMSGSKEYARGDRETLYQVASNKQGHPLEFLVIRSLGGIGDVLMTTPACRQLKEEFPNVRITYAADRHSTKHDDYYELLKNLPFIDNVVDARRVDKAQYDAWVDITSVCIKHENNLQQAIPLNRIDIFSKACGIPKLKDPVPAYTVEPSERANAQEKLAHLDKKKVFLHTASFDAKRCWPAYKYEELIDLAAREAPGITFLVSDFNNVLPKRSQYMNCLDVTSPLIRDVAALIEQSDFFVGVDSGPMHLAGALHTPGLALFGSIPYQCRLNHYPWIKPITPSIYVCGKPCMYQRCDYQIRCMTDIQPAHVFAELRKELGL